MTLPVRPVGGRLRSASRALDLADAVQAWRDLAWCILVVTDISADLAFVFPDDNEAQRRLLELIDGRADVAHNAMERASLVKLAVRARELVSAMSLELLVPSEDDLVWRFVTGDIEPVTACHVAGCSHEHLLDICRFRGWPT